MPSSQDAAHVLLVEDDPKIADMVANYLEAQGFAHTTVGNGLDAVERAKTLQPNLMLLDLMLPGMDGIEVCKAVRGFSDVPIIMVTARVDEIDRLLGLEIGADDYVCKPFSPRELVARMRALLRRTQGALTPSRKAGLGDAEAAHAAPPTSAQLLDHTQRMQILYRGAPLPLTPVEYRLLSLFVARPGFVFARSKLLDHVHLDFRDVSDRAIDSHIKNIRRKLEQAQANGVGIASVYGVGYRLDVDA